jgi:hypothetical protein
MMNSWRPKQDQDCKASGAMTGSATLSTQDAHSNVHLQQAASANSKQVDSLDDWQAWIPLLLLVALVGCEIVSRRELVSLPAGLGLSRRRPQDSHAESWMLHASLADRGKLS